MSVTGKIGINYSRRATLDNTYKNALDLLAVAHVVQERALKQALMWTEILANQEEVANLIDDELQEVKQSILEIGEEKSRL